MLVEVTGQVVRRLGTLHEVKGQWYDKRLEWTVEDIVGSHLFSLQAQAETTADIHLPNWALGVMEINAVQVRRIQALEKNLKGGKRAKESCFISSNKYEVFLEGMKPYLEKEKMKSQALLKDFRRMEQVCEVLLLTRTSSLYQHQNSSVMLLFERYLMLKLRDRVISSIWTSFFGWQKELLEHFFRSLRRRRPSWAVTKGKLFGNGMDCLSRRISYF